MKSQWEQAVTFQRLLIASALVASLFTLRAVASPSVGVVTSNDSGSGIGRYQKFELTFPVQTAATNLQLPYDSTTPPYAANLKPMEDARQGVSVDGLFLPPGQTDWSRALVQPGFLYRDYVRTPPLPASHHMIEDLVSTGQDAWKVRFAPTALGVWQYRLRVADASGTALTPPGSVVCAPSPSKGFVRVSASDSRYFEFDSGAPINLVGTNLFFDGADQFQTALNQISSTGASGLIRLWIAGRSGQEVIGGFANSSGGRLWIFDGATQLVGTGAHSGRFCLSIPSDGGATTKEVPCKPNTGYTVTAWVKPQGAASIMVTTQDSDTYANTSETTIPLQGTDWMRITVPIAAHDPQNGANYFATLKFLPKGGGSVLLDDVQALDGVTGADTFEMGDFERHVEFSQRQSWLLDQVVDSAAKAGQYLRLNCLENDDSVFCNIGGDGLPADHDQNNFWGKSVDPKADLPVRRFQRYYARYLVARWGYSTAVAQWEYNNEGALFNGNHYAGAQSFAAAIHSFSAEGHRPASTSFYQNAGGTSYPQDFYDSGTFPDIDYADVHYYPSPGVPGSSYDPFGPGYGGFVRVGTGGPNGLGVMHLDGTATAGQAQHTQFPLSKIRGRGTWTISYQLRADAAAKLNWFGRGPDLEFWCDDLQMNAFTIPNNPGSPTLPAAGSTDWQTYSATFAVPDDAVHSVSLWAYACSLSGGSVDFSDIRVTAPDGRLWAHYTFCEPLMDHDTASFAQYLGLNDTSLSGDPSVGKPLSIGETDIISPDGSYNTQIQQDTAGVFMRQFCWAHLNPSGAMPFLYTNAGGQAITQGFWKYATAYQKFLQGVPLSNGRYRDIDAQTSSPDLIVIGQKDSQAGRAQFFLYNRAGNWYDLCTNAASVRTISGTVTVTGLPDGAYTVETWNTSLGKVQSTAPAVSLGGKLLVPVNDLASDEAFKIAPVLPPLLSVSLSVDKAVAKPGDLVHYKLTYANASVTEALGVTIPWPIPVGTQFVSAGAGGAFNAARNEVDWSLGTVPRQTNGELDLTVRVNQ